MKALSIVNLTLLGHLLACSPVRHQLSETKSVETATLKTPKIGGCYEIKNVVLSSKSLLGKDGKFFDVRLGGSGTGIAVKLLRVDQKPNSYPRALVIIKESLGYEDGSFGKEGWLGFGGETMEERQPFHSDELAKAQARWNRFFEKEVDPIRCVDNKHLVCNKDCGPPFSKYNQKCYENKEKRRCNRYILDHREKIFATDCAGLFSSANKV